MKGNLFQKAKIKLTVFYATVMFCILVLFTSILMFTIESKLRTNFDGKIITSQEQEDPVKNASDDIEAFVYAADGTLLIIISILSYFLAGRTLKPIKETLDAQTKFSMDASHDLRTPLAIIMTESEVLLQGNEHNVSAYKKVVESNLEEAKKMNLLVNDLLTIARGENSQIEKEKVDFSTLIVNILNKMNQQVENKNLVLEQTIERDIVVHVNKVDIERAVKNILQNSINYTMTGTIQVVLKKENKKMILEIKDTGVGISQKDLPFIFDRFYKAEHSRNDESNSGLGLPIAKMLLERNGGSVHITSNVGVGTNVIIYIS